MFLRVVPRGTSNFPAQGFRPTHGAKKLFVQPCRPKIKMGQITTFAFIMLGELAEVVGMSP